MKLKQGSLETTLLFLATPFLSIPFLLFQIKRRDKFASVLLALLIGLVGYLYVPAVSNDKAKYYERYEVFKDFSFNQFVDFLVQIKKPDFILDFIIFSAAQLNIHLEFMVFVITFLCVYFLIDIVNQLIIKTGQAKYNYLFLMCFLLMSFSLPSLFSGVRFTFGATVLLYGIFNLIFRKKKLLGVVLIILSTQIHFSLLYFIPALLLVNTGLRRHFNFRLLFLISFVFFLIPSSITSALFSSVNLSDSMSFKTSIYVDGEDFVSQNFDSNQSSVLIYIFRTLWYYAMIIYLMVNQKKLVFDSWSQSMVNLLYVFVFFVNFTYSFTTIFSRYTLILKLFFFIYLTYCYLHKRIQKSQFFYIILFLYLLTFLVDVNVLRNNILVSLINKDNFLMIQILNNKMHVNEFLK